MTKLGFAGVISTLGETLFKWQILLGCFFVGSPLFIRAETNAGTEAVGYSASKGADSINVASKGMVSKNEALNASGEAANTSQDAVESANQASTETATQIRPGSAVDSLITDPSYYVQILLVLAFVIGLIFVCAWLAKKINTGGFMGSQQMKLLGGLSVGTRERVVLVEVGEKQILLGVAPGRVNSLHVFDEPVITPQTAEMSDFSRKLQQLLRKDVQRDVKASQPKSPENSSTGNPNSESKKCEE